MSSIERLIIAHLLKRLVREGRIVREGGGFHPVETETTVQ